MKINIKPYNKEDIPMRTRSQKLLALALAALMLLPLAACATSGDDPNAETTGTNNSPVSEADTADLDYMCDLPANMDFKDTEVFMMALKSAGRDDELISPKLTSEIIPDAVYERNLAVENQCGVKLSFVEQDSDTVAQSTINTLVTAGDRSIDIFSIGTNWGLALSIQGRYQNLNNVENINLEKKYWAQDYNNMCTFTSDNKQFMVTSPAAISLFRLTYLTIFNRELFEERNIPDLYETVNAGKWTLDYQYSIVSDVYVDADGDGKKSEDDFFGFITGNCISTDAYPTASNVRLVIRDEEGYMDFNVNDSEKLISMAEKVSTLYNCQGTYFFQNSTYDDIGKHYICEKFAAEEGLMATTQFLSIETNIELLAGFTYGIVPMPKLSEEQKNYMTYVQDQVTGFGISAAIASDDRLACLGAVMESMAYQSYKIVRPAYYDNTLSVRFMQDPQSRAILDTMFETISFDYAFATGIGSVRDSLRTMVSSSNPAVASRLRGWERTIKNQLKKENNSLDKLP